MGGGSGMAASGEDASSFLSGAMLRVLIYERWLEREALDGMEWMGMLLNADGRRRRPLASRSCDGHIFNVELQYVSYNTWYCMVTNLCSCITVNILTLLNRINKLTAF